MQIPATTYGIVHQGGSIYGLEKRLEGFVKVRTRSTGPNLTAVDVGWNGALLLRSDYWGSEYLEYHTDFGDRMVSYTPTCGCRSVERSRSYISSALGFSL
jgi:hypothetical protein